MILNEWILAGRKSEDLLNELLAPSLRDLENYWHALLFIVLALRVGYVQGGNFRVILHTRTDLVLN